MDISTSYLGFKLSTPLIPGASPPCNDLAAVRELEDAGAPMLTMHSVFQEQFDLEEMAVNRSLDGPLGNSPEALSYFPSPEQFRLGPEEYIDQIIKIKKTVKIPVIASLNGRTPGGWVSYATKIEQAGADALELNIYNNVFDLERSSEAIENDTLDVVRAVRQAVKLPLAVKLSRNYTGLPQFVNRLVKAGVQGLVLFNRFYQPDIDIEDLDVRRELKLSTSDELLPRIRWTAALAGRVKADLAVTGGVHSVEDVVKAFMAGASVVQMVSALLTRGPQYLKHLADRLAKWLEEHEYESLAQMRGSMSLLKTPHPEAFERGNYVKILHAWEPA
ncbi:MAG: dihydroorotate dehydrogenase-like protein [Phycisphaerales bacterium]|nr:dihydroorotate dehydrogenase-like protein [Phycisphaerales bacterium]